MRYIVDPTGLFLQIYIKILEIPILVIEIILLSGAASIGVGVRTIGAEGSVSAAEAAVWGFRLGWGEGAEGDGRLSSARRARRVCGVGDFRDKV